jgi:hypothetical protein
MLEECKTALRVTVSNTAFDSEILSLIGSATYDLHLAGIEAAGNIDDPLIIRAIVLYVKSNFGFDNPDAERLQKSYDMLKMHLSLSTDYNTESE